MLIDSIQTLEDVLTTPSKALVRDLAALNGDVLILGASGKMGPTLALMAQRALSEAGRGRRVIAVARFSDPAARRRLDDAGISTITADLHDPRCVTELPDAALVIFMVGMKFGTSGREHQTWATNAYLPGRIAERYAASRMVIFSSGNVYPLTPVTGGGATEETAPAPVGEYAQSCLARERIFEHFSRVNQTPMIFFRLNYAIDLRYGVLLDIGQAVYKRQPIDLSMGNVNVIWQGDANEYALRALQLSSAPPALLNVTGPETISVRWLAAEFAKRFGVEPICQGEEAPTALLSNAARCFAHFGYPRVTLMQMLDWTAEWVLRGGPSHHKPTHFQERAGTF